MYPLAKKTYSSIASRTSFLLPTGEQKARPIGLEDKILPNSWVQGANTYGKSDHREPEDLQKNQKESKQQP